jgi:glycosyltransferase involved in cell wall biosynthesis
MVVRNGIPLTHFHRAANPALRAALTKKPELPVVLTTARLDAQKGHRYLIEAAARVPKATFVFAGEGPERGALEAYAHMLGVDDRVVFLGYRKDIPDLLASCDLFVLPSLYEGFPLSILEAMAAGKPVIASAAGGSDEAIVHEETGLLVPQADAASLTRTIQRVLSDPALALRLAAAGKARAYEEFSIETMVQRVTDVYHELLASRRFSNSCS